MSERPMVTRGLGLALATLTALYFMARTTGSGWMMVLFSALSAIIVVSAVWSLAALRSTQIEAKGPSDATVGERVTVTVRSTGRSDTRVCICMPPTPGSDHFKAIGPPAPLGARQNACVDAVTTVRGIARVACLELSCGGPLGLVWWRRRDVVTLATPTFVGPRPSAARVKPLAPETGNGRHHRSATPTDRVRTIREYETADPMRAVHWPATARMGRPMVKEYEGEDETPCRFVVDLTGSDGEGIASDVACAAIEALRAGREVQLVTMEAGGVVDDVVRSAREIGRRLARTVTSTAPPARWQ